MKFVNAAAGILLFLGAVTAAALPAAAQDRAALTAALNRERQGNEAQALAVSADLNRVAEEVAMRAIAGAAGSPGAALAKPDIAAVEASLLERFYIPMQLDVLVSVAGSDAQQAVDQWRRSKWPSVGDPALQEVGTAVLWNRDAPGPGSRYIWVAVLARPLRTPAESVASPRFGFPERGSGNAKP